MIILTKMIVLVLHPTEQLKLSTFQKEICASFTGDKKYIFPSFPLWFPIPEDFYNADFFSQQTTDSNLKIGLKEISKKIDKLNIDIFCPEQEEIPLIQLHIFSNGKEFVSSIPLYAEYEKLSLQQKENIYKKIGSSDLFPMSLKIFRIAKVIKLTEKSQGLQAFVWKKLE